MFLIRTKWTPFSSQHCFVSEGVQYVFSPTCCWNISPYNGPSFNLPTDKIPRKAAKRSMWSHVYVLPVATVAFLRKSSLQPTSIASLTKCEHDENLRFPWWFFGIFSSRHGKTKQKTYATLQQPLRRNWLVLIFWDPSEGKTYDP